MQQPCPTMPQSCCILVTASCRRIESAACAGVMVSTQLPSCFRKGMPCTCACIEFVVRCSDCASVVVSDGISGVDAATTWQRAPAITVQYTLQRGALNLIISSPPPPPTLTTATPSLLLLVGAWNTQAVLMPRGLSRVWLPSVGLCAYVSSVRLVVQPWHWVLQGPGHGGWWACCEWEQATQSACSML